MLTLPNLYSYSAGYLANVGGYSPAIAGANAPANFNAEDEEERKNNKIVSINSYQHSLTKLTPPYECKYLPSHYTSILFDDFDKYSRLFLPSTPSIQYHMHLPLTSPLTNPSATTETTVSSPTSARSAFRQISNSVVETKTTQQRTQSVIMKVEDQKIVVISAQNLDTYRSADLDEEISICKWRKCYR